MKVVILCGGRGSRLQEETIVRPKPMVTIGDYPILWHIMKIYSSFGFSDFILCLGYKGEIIKEFFKNYMWHQRDVTMNFSNGEIIFHEKSNELNWNITFAETGLDSMTAFRLNKVKKYLSSENNFMLTYGDGVGDIDLIALLDHHKKKDKICTISGVHPPGRFGELSHENDQVISFNEKPQAEGGFINGGFMVCNREVFKYIDDDPKTMFEGLPMQNLVKSKELNLFKHFGFWHPMDTYPEYQYLNKLWKNDQAPWKIW